MRVRLCTLVVVLALAGALPGLRAQVRRAAPVPRPAGPPPAPVGVETSPIVTWDPDKTISRPPTKRALTGAELSLARQRADQFYKAVQASRHFTSPTDRATLVTSWAVITPQGMLNQRFIPYWSSPRDVTRRPDGSLWPRTGGAHRLLYVETNLRPNAESLYERDQNTFVRRAASTDGDVWFPFPAVRGAIAGGVVFTDYVIFTRDGRPALEPAPIGPLLEQEIARLREYTKGIDTTRALEQLEASMTPEAKAARRARREEVWRKETKDPRHWYWGTRLALKQLETTLNALDAAGRGAPACARLDTSFGPHAQMRYAIVVEGQPARGCVAMAQVRTDLVDPTRPTSEVQLLTVWFRERVCGAKWNAAPPATTPARGDLCDDALPLLREMDWGAVRRALDWPEP